MKGLSGKLTQTIKGFGARFIYLIGDEGAILVYIEGGTVQRRLFAPTADKQHTKAFLELMEEYPHAPIYALIDMMDQSYIRHTLPPVTPLGLNKIIQRRLDRDFAKEDIKGALNLGREKKGRKDWNFLLISLAYSPELQSWLDLVLDIPNRFAGIYLVPVECEHIIASLAQKTQQSDEGGQLEARKKDKLKSKLAKKDPAGRSEITSRAHWQILVSHHKVGGYRQVVLKNGKLVFTRITQGSDTGSPEMLAGSVEQEVQNTIEYLKRLSFSDQSDLDIYIILAQEIKNNISRERLPARQVHIFTPYEAAELLDLKQAVLSGDRFGDMVIATAFGLAKKPRLKLNPTYAEKLDKLYQAKYAIRASGALAATGLLLYALVSLLSIPGAVSRIGDLETRKRGQEAEFARFQETSANLKVDADQVNDLVSVNGIINAPAPDVFDSVHKLQGLITDLSLLHNFSWSVENLLAQEESKKPTVQIDMEVELLYFGGPWDHFRKQTDEYFIVMQKAFPDYKMDRTNLPGEADTTGNFVVDFEEKDARESAAEQGESYELRVTLAGPIEADPNAAAPVDGSGAPPL